MNEYFKKDGGELFSPFTIGSARTDFSVVSRGILNSATAEREIPCTDSACVMLRCESGRCVALIRGEKAELCPGQTLIFIASPECEFSFSEDFSALLNAYIGTLARSLFSLYLQSKQFSVSDSPRSDGFIKHLRSAKNGETDAQTAAFELHSLLFSTYRNEETAEKKRLASVEALREYIDLHTDKKLTLDELSKRFFISKTQIFRLFKQTYGIAPMKYMLERKIEVSKSLLASPQMRVSDIAEALCFTDAKHFTKTFKSVTGILPREYRKLISNNNNKHS